MVGDSLVLVTEGSECRTKKIVQASCCCLLAAVQHAVAADKGLSTLGRRSTSRGRAALQMIRRPPRGPGSGTIDHHVTALAAERQGVGRTHDDGYLS